MICVCKIFVWTGICIHISVCQILGGRIPSILSVCQILDWNNCINNISVKYWDKLFHPYSLCVKILDRGIILHKDAIRQLLKHYRGQWAMVHFRLSPLEGACNSVFSHNHLWNVSLQWTFCYPWSPLNRPWVFRGNLFLFILFTSPITFCAHSPSSVTFCGLWFSAEKALVTHGPHRWNCGSSHGHFLLLLLLLLLLHTSNFPGSPVTPISSFSFYFLEHFFLENCPLLSGELSTDTSDSYFSSVQGWI